MNRTESILILTFAVGWCGLFGFYHLTIAAVNRGTAKEFRIPHVRYLGGGVFSYGFEWKALIRQYRRLYSSGPLLYGIFGSITLISVTAITFVLLRIWEYRQGQLP